MTRSEIMDLDAIRENLSDIRRCVLGGHRVSEYSIELGIYTGWLSRILKEENIEENFHPDSSDLVKLEKALEDITIHCGS